MNLSERDHLEDLRRRWEDNIRIDLKDVELGGNGLNYSGAD